MYMHICAPFPCCRFSPHTIFIGSLSQVFLHRASGFERESVQIAAVESARLFTGSVDVAVRVRNKLRAMSDDEWWMYVFVLHPSICTWVHSRDDCDHNVDPLCCAISYTFVYTSPTFVYKCVYLSDWQLIHIDSNVYKYPDARRCLYTFGTRQADLVYTFSNKRYKMSIHILSISNE